MQQNESEKNENLLIIKDRKGRIKKKRAKKKLT